MTRMVGIKILIFMFLLLEFFVLYNSRTCVVCVWNFSFQT